VTPVDQAIGARVKQRRNALGMRQTNLGEKIGVTFQQLQKYEQGANRIGAGRLAAIATALNVPITFFFDQAEAGSGSLGEEDAVVLALQDPVTVELVRAFAAVSDPIQRRRVLEFVRALSGSEEEEPAAKPPVPSARRGRPAGDGAGRSRR